MKSKQQQHKQTTIKQTLVLSVNVGQKLMARRLYATVAINLDISHRIVVVVQLHPVKHCRYAIIVINWTYSTRDTSTYQTASAAISCFCEEQNGIFTQSSPIQKGNACVQIGARNVLINDNTNCECVGESELKLACGKVLPIFSGACRVVSKDMPVTKGLVGDVMVDMLRDTGCSGVAVNRSMINDDQLLNKTERCM